jgi:integrase
MAKRKAITPLTLENLKPGTDTWRTYQGRYGKLGTKRVEIPDTSGNGLMHVVQPSGAHSYAVRGRLNHKPFKLTLDDGIDLADARKKAIDVGKEAKAGVDPCAAKKATTAANKVTAANTVSSVLEQFGEFKHRDRKRGTPLRSSQQHVGNVRRWIVPVLGDRPITSIKRTELVRLADAITGKKILATKKPGKGRKPLGGPSAARHAMASLCRVFNWWSKRDDDFSNPITRGTFEFAKEESDRILTDDELRAVWAATAEPTAYHRLVRFILLTTCRRSEASGLAYGELKGRDWTLPGSRNKVKVDLIRTLPPTAMTLVGEGDGDALVFATRNGHALKDFVRLKRTLDKECGVKDWTLHSLRRTGRSLLSRVAVTADGIVVDAGAEDLSPEQQKIVDASRRIDADVRERVLGHVIGGVKGLYDKYAYKSEKREALELLSKLVETIVNPPPPADSNVRRLRA